MHVFFSTLAALALMTGIALADLRDTRFASIDGGDILLSDFAGQPILVVNTASQCAFTRQYAGLQDLYDQYKSAGLVVLAVPSDDFQQELDTADAVKEFCELNYDLTLPMTDITQVTGRSAHPFYRNVKEMTGFEPRWNFNKVLIGPDGSVVGTWGSGTRPNSPAIKSAILDALTKRARLSGSTEG